MAPLLLLFLLGGLCALFSLTTSSRASAKKCEDVKSDGCVPEETPQQQQQGEKKQARADPEKDLGIVFSTFDHDGDGFITAVELEESLRRLGIAVSADEAAAMVARVDANSDGLIDIHEFRELYDSIPKKRKHQHPAAAAAAGDFSGAAREVPVEGDDEEAEGEEEEEEEDEERDLREAFDVFDGNKDGLISAEELGTVLGSLGLRRQGNGRPAVADCRDMIRLVDSDGDGMVSFEEFKRMMTVVKA
jgi:Ca2+-binding EF-hand superfamily protein